MPTRPAVKNAPAFPPWFFFLVFLAANTLISYSAFPLGAKMGLGFAGILLPFLLALRQEARSATRDFFPKDFLPPIPRWAWVFLGAAAFFIRFCHLTSLSGWPITDETYHAIFGYHLMRHADASLLYGIARLPPGYFWALAGVFKVCGVSLWSLWFLPAVLSFLAFLFSAAAARSFFSSSLAFVISCLMALGFGSFYCGRISHTGVLAFFWECFCLFIISRSLKAGNARSRMGWALGLGLATGAGFYTFTSWWSVFVPITVWVLFREWKRGKGGIPAAAGFLAALFVSAGPFWVNWARQGASSYFSGLFLLHDAASFNYGWKYALSNVTMWFWGADPLGQCYRPVWGGILNPILGAAFFLGLVRVFRSIQEGWSFFSLAAIGLCLLPGLATASVEMYRVLPVLPFLLMVCGLGAARLFSGSGKAKAAWGLAGFLALSFSLDAYHLFGPYHREWGTPNPDCADFKSVERWRAFQELETQARSSGPGLLFTDFALKTMDQSLAVAGYSFDALRNPSLGTGSARWFAVLCNPHFAPFLQKRFPGSRWTWLSQDLSRPDGGLSLGIVPLSAPNSPEIQKWISANQAFRQLTLETIFQTGIRPGNEITAELQGLEPLAKGDPFLESCLWEKLEFYHVIEGDLPGALEDLKKGLALGYPNAFFDDQMGLVLWKENRLKEAMLYFKKALECRVNLTPAAENLRELKITMGGPGKS